MPNPFQVPHLYLSWIGHDQDTHGGKDGIMQAQGCGGVKNKIGTRKFVRELIDALVGSAGRPTVAVLGAKKKGL